MIDDYEQKYDIVVDRSEFEGEIVVPQHLRKSGGGFQYNRISGGGLLGSLTRSRTLLTMSGGPSGGGNLVHGSVPDLSRSSISSRNSGMGTPTLLEESSDYKLKEATGSDPALDGGDPFMIPMSSNQRITKSRGKKLYAAKSTNHLLTDDGVQMRRNSDDYYPHNGGGGVGGGGSINDGQRPSQLLESFQARNASLDRPAWSGGDRGTSPPPPPSRASSIAMLQNHFNNPHYHQSLNHYHYDPTRYHESNHSSQRHTNQKQNHNINIVSVNNSTFDLNQPSNGSSTHTLPSPARNVTTTSSKTSPNVRRWDEGRSSLSRRPNFGGLGNRSVSTTSLASIGSHTSSKGGGSGGDKGKGYSARAKYQLELQKMKDFNSYAAAVGSLDRQKKAKRQENLDGSVSPQPPTVVSETMTLDRPRARVNNGGTAIGGGGDSTTTTTATDGQVVAIRTTTTTMLNGRDTSSLPGGAPVVEGSGGGGQLYKIPRPIMERSLSEQPQEQMQQRFQAQRSSINNDTGIEIVVDNKPAVPKLVLRTFEPVAAVSHDAHVLFCESSSDGDCVATMTLNDDEDDQDDLGRRRGEGGEDSNSLGANDSAA